MFLTERTLDRIIGQLNFDQNLNSILDKVEYAHLERNGLLEETCDKLYIPNCQMVSAGVYKITKLYNTDFDMLRFIDHIIETIPLPFEISLNVGFFVYDECKNVLEYVEPSATQSVVTAGVTNLEHYWRFRRDIRHANGDLLRAAYNNAIDRRQINAWTKPVSAIMLCLYNRKI